jgi:cardiolipin synthase
VALHRDGLQPRHLDSLAASAVLYTIAGIRDFRPSIFGKANTFAQVSAIFFVLLFEVYRAQWVFVLRTAFLWATFAFTVISGVHYVFLAQHRMRDLSHGESPATNKKQVA